MNKELEKTIHDMFKDIVNTVKAQGKDITYFTMSWCDEEDGHHFIMSSGLNNDRVAFRTHEDLGGSNEE